jgi:hypothetical protein
MTTLRINIEPEAFVEGLDRADSRALIKAIDDRQCDCAFTVGIIKMLIEELRYELTIEEIMKEIGLSEPEA